MKAIINVETGDVTYREETPEEVAVAASFDTPDPGQVVTRAELDAVLAEIRDQVVAELSPASVNTILETKDGIIEAFTDVAAE